MTPSVEDIVAIRLFRSVHDPIIYHGRSNGYEGFVPEWVKEAVLLARTKRAYEAPIDEPTRNATWPEIAAHLQSATGDAGAIDEKFVMGYAHAAEKSAEIYGAHISSSPNDDIESPFSSHGKQIGADMFLEDLRRDIQRSLNNRAVDDYRSEISGSDLPTWVWKHQSSEKPDHSPSTSADQDGKTKITDFI